MITAGAALLIAGALLWVGRRDLTRPAVAFGVPWFAAAALAQVRLTELEAAWSTGFTLIVLGGGMAFVIAATLAGGIAPARGALAVDPRELRVRRLVTAAVVLIAAGVVGTAYKAEKVGGVPLLSANPDLVRGRALGGVDLPAWSTALTDGFFLGMWCALAAIWALPSGTPRLRRAGLWLLALAALFGVSLEASRNLVVLAVTVPLIAAYLLARRRRRGADLAWVGAAVCVLAVGVGGLFVLRIGRGDTSADAYIEREADRHPPAVRPLVPVYVNVVYPFEAARRVNAGVPDRFPYGLGANSLTSLPDAAFPEGKPLLGNNVAAMMSTPGKERLTWTVAGYQGRLLADLGWRGVLLGSILLGLAFGSLYRWARARSGLLALAVIAYVTYYSAFMVYDNQLSFSLIAAFDLAVIALINAYVRGWIDEPLSGFAEVVRRTAR